MAGFPYTIDDLKQNEVNNLVNEITTDYNLQNNKYNFATGVGLSLAEEYQRNYFKSKNIDLINHYTYVILSDEDLMDGLSYEAASIAGNLKLKGNHISHHLMVL